MTSISGIRRIAKARKPRFHVLRLHGHGRLGPRLPTLTKKVHNVSRTPVTQRPTGIKEKKKKRRRVELGMYKGRVNRFDVSSLPLYLCVKPRTN